MKIEEMSMIEIWMLEIVDRAELGGYKGDITDTKNQNRKNKVRIL